MGKKPHLTPAQILAMRKELKSAMFSSISDEEYNVIFKQASEFTLKATLMILSECGEWDSDGLHKFCEAYQEVLTAYEADPKGTTEHINAVLEEADIKINMKVEA